MKDKPIFAKTAQFQDARMARAAGWYPYFKPIQRSQGSKVYIEDRALLMMGSNNYLGLANDPRLKEAAEEVVERYGTSCSGSRFMNGTLDLHVEFEEELAEFVGRESAVCFSTGYQTNLGALSALLGRGDHVICDKFNHASIFDGIFLADGTKKQVTLHRYKHNSMKDLERVLSCIPPEAPKLIVIDGVFSMEGDIALLPEIRALAEAYDAGVYIDEAHALGVIGESGRGTCEYYGGGEELADVLMCTFSKSFGSIGGFVAGSEELIDYIRHHARSLIFSASMPPANIAAARKALEIMLIEPERITRLQDIAKRMLSEFRAMGFDVGTSQTPIMPIVIGDNQLTFQLWKALYDRGIYVNPVISPAVPPKRSLLRVSFMAVHTDSELDQFAQVTREEAGKLGII